MLKIAVADDEKVIAAQIEELLEEICEREKIPVEIDVFYSGRELRERYESGEVYDLLYLDIQMEDIDGISAAEKIREIDESVMIIFISGYDKYMISLFRLDVYAFLRKPVCPEEFERTFHGVYDKISRYYYYFTYRHMNMDCKVLCRDILYFQSAGRKISIYLRGNQKEEFNGKLTEVEKELLKGKISFLRIHQSYLVNYHMIRSKTKAEVILVNGERLPISKERRKDFCEEYNKRLAESIVGKIGM